MLKSISYGECTFAAGCCTLIVRREYVEMALKLAGFPGSVSFDTPIVITYGKSYPSRRQMKGSPDYLEVGAGWFMDFNQMQDDFRGWETRACEAADKLVHPLSVGTRIVSILGELDHDENDEERSAEPGSIGKVEGAQCLLPEHIWNYKVVFPNGTWVFINSRELSDASRYTVLPEKPCPSSKQATP